ncbi:hypothetical protein [Dyella tabacisoli]|uniref:Uncharacterized protein n=1 Tax=Dyella tabacisoli TaxID=2282381 RepID=A0A369UPD6_9GAMM|nr:hypothetical protein [Dyella tabacisoli]RDD81578.1 hypothetical protein DVJ77_10405 [Dyella tabacisoli]
MNQELARPSGLSYQIAGAAVLAELLLLAKWLLTIALRGVTPEELIASAVSWLPTLLTSMAVVFVLAQSMLDRRAVQKVDSVWAFAGRFGLLYLVFFFVLNGLIKTGLGWLGSAMANNTYSGVYAAFLAVRWVISLFSGWLALSGCLHMFRDRITYAPAVVLVPQRARASLLFAALYLVCLLSGVQAVMLALLPGEAGFFYGWSGLAVLVPLGLCVLLTWAGAWKGMRGYAGPIRVRRLTLAALLSLVCQSLLGGLLFLVGVLMGSSDLSAMIVVTLLVLASLFPIAWGFSRLLGGPSVRVSARAVV